MRTKGTHHRTSDTRESVEYKHLRLTITTGGNIRRLDPEAGLGACDRDPSQHSSLLQSQPAVHSVSTAGSTATPVGTGFIEY